MNGQLDSLVLDASVLINILATGFAREIFTAIQEPCLVPQAVASEVHRDPRDRKKVEPLGAYVNGGIIKIVDFNDRSLETFVSLVGGDLEESLDDGEAATLAIAHDQGFVAAIDENKARNLASRRFPNLSCVRTVDLLRRPELLVALSSAPHLEAVTGALEFGRMQIPAEHRQWIRALLGDDRADQFPALRTKSAGPPVAMRKNR